MTTITDNFRRIAEVKNVDGSHRFPWLWKECPDKNTTIYFKEGVGLTMRALHLREVWHDTGQCGCTDGYFLIKPEGVRLLGLLRVAMVAGVTIRFLPYDNTRFAVDALGNGIQQTSSGDLTDMLTPLASALCKALKLEKA